MYVMSSGEYSVNITWVVVLAVGGQREPRTFSNMIYLTVFFRANQFVRLAGVETELKESTARKNRYSRLNAN